MVVDQRTPQVAKHRGLKRLRNTASRTRDDQLIVHRQGRAPDNTCVFDFKGGTPLAGAHLTRPKSRNGHSKPRQRDSLPYASRKGLYASQINAARRQHSRHRNPTSPELAAKQHQPNTHLNPRSRAKTACAATTVNGTQHKPITRSQTRLTHTHTHARRSKQSHISTQQTPAAKRQATNTAMHRIHTSPISSPNGAPPHRKSPHPNPASPRDESTHTKEDTNQHTAPAAPPPELPQTSSQLTYNVRG
jgi:hypothetical protein